MLFLRFLLLAGGFVLLAGAAGLALYDICLALELDRLLRRREEPTRPASSEAAPPPPEARRQRQEVRWGLAARIAAVAGLSMLVGSSIVVLPDGRAAVRISQISGVRP